MTQLNQQTIKITQQNALNAKSTRGVYLLPEAKTRRGWRARSAPCACRWAVLPRMAMGHA